nr:hypothetical protein [Mycoplasmopsis bovis]
MLGIKEKIINPLPVSQLRRYRDEVIKYMTKDLDGLSIVALQ